MARRPILYTLVGLILVQGVVAAQSHGGVSRHDPSGAYRPPHFHLRTAFLWLPDDPERVERSDSQERGVRSDVADHDADAVYLPEGDVAALRHRMLILPAIVDRVACVSVTLPTSLQFHITWDRRDSPVEWAVPIYLRSTSLLI
jgi:hypothetical protein